MWRCIDQSDHSRPDTTTINETNTRGRRQQQPNTIAVPKEPPSKCPLISKKQEIGLSYSKSRPIFSIFSPFNQHYYHKKALP